MTSNPTSTSSHPLPSSPQSATAPPTTSTSMSTPTPTSSPSSSSSSGGASFTDALKTISPLTDLQKLPSIPCARFSLLFGIVAGTSIGSLRFLFSHSGSWSRRVGSLKTAAAAAGGGGGYDRRWQNVGSAANWAVGSWGVASLGAWETCRRRQTAEAARMQALVSEVKARRAAKSSSSSASSSGSAQGDQRPIGGVLIGEHGKEVLQDKQQQQQQQQQKEGGVKSKWNW
ncbi:hypothetical protein ACM66B_003364 [Microbotryomycetes sp. NB124-2]